MVSAPTQLAINYFKRNKDAQAAHVVLQSVFASLPRAERYRKAVYAKKVTSFLRMEFTEQLGEKGSDGALPSVNPPVHPETDESGSSNSKNLTNDNRNPRGTRSGRRSAAKSE